MTTDPTLLVDGRHSFEDLVAIDRLGSMIQAFSMASGFTTGLISHPGGSVLVATGRRHVCTSFHRAVPSSCGACLRCETAMTAQLSKQQPLIVHRCENGLVEGAAAIIIKDAHVASLYSGQVFLEEPDLQYFKRQARTHGFDPEGYLEAIADVPVVDEESFVHALEFLRETAVLVAEQGLATLEISATARAVRESEAKFRALVETSSDWIWEVDGNGVYTYASPQVTDILGYAPGEIIGKTPFDLMSDDEAARVARTFNDLFKDGRPIVALENVNLHKDGHKVVLETSGVPVLDGSGNPIGYRGVDRDITERKHADDERQTVQRLKSIGILAGGIAHDFNNILMGLYGNLSLAIDRLPPGHPAAKPLGDAERSMERATRLTHQLLTFSKGGAPVREPTDLGDLVREIAAFHLSGSSVSTVLEIAPDLWPVEIDRGQMQQAFSNLLINAVQAMPDGGRIHVSMANEQVEDGRAGRLEPGRYVRTSLRDEGVGVPDELRDKIFDPYFTTKPSGSGLGLTTTYSIVDKHGGHLILESEPGRGTTFTLHLPASNTLIASASPHELEQSETDEKSARILVMDDEEIVLDVVRQMLENIGYEVETAVDGADASRLYRRALDDGDRFDAVIMDLTIPGGVGGKEAVRTLLDVDPDATVVVSSGYADDPVLANHTEYGFADMIVKPFSLDKLKEVMFRVL